MHTRTNTQAQSQTKKPFHWGISTQAITFMQTDVVKAARDGTQDCSKISPMPMPTPKRAVPGRDKGQE